VFRRALTWEGRSLMNHVIRREGDIIAPNFFVTSRNYASRSFTPIFKMVLIKTLILAFISTVTAFPPLVTDNELAVTITRRRTSNNGRTTLKAGHSG